MQITLYGRPPFRADEFGSLQRAKLRLCVEAASAIRGQWHVVRTGGLHAG